MLTLTKLITVAALLVIVAVVSAQYGASLRCATDCKCLSCSCQRGTSECGAD